MARLKQKTAIFGVLLSTFLLAGCLVDFGEKDISQFAPLSGRAAVDGTDTAAVPTDGFFGDGPLGEGDVF